MFGLRTFKLYAICDIGRLLGIGFCGWIVQIEEIGDTDAIYESPKMAYEQKLTDAIPKGI